MRLLLGFGSKARHGKDSAAVAIQTFFESQFPKYPKVKIFKFAGALYDVCREEYGMKDKDAPLLQRVGQEKRKEDPTYWINRLRFSIGSFDGVGIITDVRYQNEATWIKSYGGLLINVTRLEENGQPFVAPDRPADHISEVDLNDWNWDGYIRTKTGQESLAAEQAITLANFFFEITQLKNV